MAGNYQVAKDFDSWWSITTHKCHHPYSTWSEVQFSLQGSHPRGDAPRNTLEDPCIQTVMNICAPSYNPVVIVEAALKVSHEELHVGSPADISKRAQERMEDHIISTLHQECLCRGIDPNQRVDQRAMIPRPWPQQRSNSWWLWPQRRQEKVA